MPRGVLVDPKADVKQEYYAGVVWDGTAKQPLLLFSDMGGIDIEQVAEEHPDHVGRGHFSTLMPFSDFQAKQVIAAAGVTGKPLQRLTPILARLAQLFLDRDMTLAEINPLAELAGRQLRRARRPHGDGGRGQAAPEEGARRARASPRTTAARATSPPRSRSPSRRSTPPTTAA